MRIVEKLIGTQVFRSGVVALVALVICLCSLLAQAQSPGNKAVYNSSDSSPTYSTAYVDASVFDNMNNYPAGDVCGDIYQAFGTLSTSASMAVIDARGVLLPISGKFTCTTAANTSGNTNPATPWTAGCYGCNTTKTLPSVILLPSGTILVGTPWILPNKTRIIGEGADSTESTGTA